MGLLSSNRFQGRNADFPALEREFAKTVDIKGTKIRTIVAPASTEKPAPTLVFIDGIRFQMSLWESQLVHCNQFANILALDLPGAGDSDSFDDYSSINLANLVHYWLKTKPWGHETPIYFVASGATVSVALLLTARLGSRCGGCILVSGFNNTEPRACQGGATTFCTTDPTLDARNMLSSGVCMGSGVRGSSKLPRALSYTNQDNTVLIDKLKKADKQLSNTRFTEYIFSHRPVNEVMARKVRAPVLIIEGEESDTTDTADVWIEWFANARLEMVMDAKTAVALEQPHVVNRLIEKFVRR